MELQQLFHSLPTINYAIFKSLTKFFLLVSQNSSKNKMNLNNILTCFTPTLKCSPIIFKFAVEDFEFFFSK